MGKTLYVAYAIIIVGLLAGIGSPFVNGYLSATEKVGECSRIGGMSEQDRCFRDAQMRVEQNAAFGRAIASVISYDSPASAKAE